MKARRKSSARRACAIRAYELSRCYCMQRLDETLVTAAAIPCSYACLLRRGGPRVREANEHRVAVAHCTPTSSSRLASGLPPRPNVVFVSASAASAGRRSHRANASDASTFCPACPASSPLPKYLHDKSNVSQWELALTLALLLSRVPDRYVCWPLSRCMPLSSSRVYGPGER